MSLMALQAAREMFELQEEENRGRNSIAKMIKRFEWLGQRVRDIHEQFTKDSQVCSSVSLNIPFRKSFVESLRKTQKNFNLLYSDPTFQVKANDYEIEDQIKTIQEEVDAATSAISRLETFLLLLEYRIKIFCCLPACRREKMKYQRGY